MTASEVLIQRRYQLLADGHCGLVQSERSHADRIGWLAVVASRVHAAATNEVFTMCSLALIGFICMAEPLGRWENFLSGSDPYRLGEVGSHIIM